MAHLAEEAPEHGPGENMIESASIEHTYIDRKHSTGNIIQRAQHRRVLFLDIKKEQIAWHVFPLADQQPTKLSSGVPLKLGQREDLLRRTHSSMGIRREILDLLHS